MTEVWRQIWAVIGLFLGVAAPVAKGATELATAFETTARVTRKAADNWEYSVDLDGVRARLELNRAQRGLEADTEAAVSA